MMPRAFFLLLTCSLLVGCTVYQKARMLDFQDRVSYVRAGMEDTRMLDLLGQPFAKVQRGDKTYYIFLANPSVEAIGARYRSVIVKDGLVTHTRSAKLSDFDAPLSAE